MYGSNAPPFQSLRRTGRSSKSRPCIRGVHVSDVRLSVTVIKYLARVSKLGPTLDELHAEIGRTLVIWGWLEGEMIDANINWRHSAPDAASGSLRAFLLDLAEPRGVRNAIAHGLASSHSDPWSPDFEPYVTCRTLDAGVRKITLGDLRRTQSQLERLRNVLRGIDLLPTPDRPRR